MPERLFAGAATARPIDTTSARVESALARLTPRQKVGQLNQRLLGWEAIERTGSGFRLSDTGRRELDHWRGLGALYGAFRADAWSGRDWSNGIRPEERAEVAALLQEEARRASGIGVLLSEEAPHGHQALGGTVLPSALAAAATWNPELMREASEAVAAQLAASGVHLALVSTLDLLRDGRWGRSEECFGADPHLASLFTTAVVEGMQGADRSAIGPGSTGVGVVLKHLAAQGEAQGGRNGQSSVIGRRDLRELHLPPVEAGVRAGAIGMMAAYNDIDGVPCCANPELLREILRHEFGFDGIIMADGLAVDRLVPLTGSVAEAGRTALLAGVDLSLWDEGFTLLEQFADEPAVATALDDACRRVLAVKDLFGLLEPESAAAPSDTAAIRLREAIETADAASERLADAAMVLLDNARGVLPLDPAEAGEILVCGPFADDVHALLGDYVAPPRDDPGGVATALSVALPTGRVRLADSDADAVAEAPAARAVVVVLGGTSRRFADDEFDGNGALLSVAATSCGEGVDLADLDLPTAQLDLVARLRAATRAPLIAVVIAGRPHVLTPLTEQCDAILWAGYAGPAGGRAVARVLLGEHSPTGLLPFTLPRHATAVAVNHTDRHSAADVYRDVPSPVLYEFGAGTGFAELEIGDLTARQIDDEVRIGFTAENPHAVPVEAVVPVFAHRRGGITVPRQRELVDVVRLTLTAGERRAAETRIPLDRCRASDAPGIAATDFSVREITITLDLHPSAAPPAASDAPVRHHPLTLRSDPR